ncbi:hypothetical protein ACFO3J_32290 [Streptomyces polygonati]|uniref:Lipoprotein n=1 Tax=Streptomyces polygonati TaxID=1617087 RepID=A0ABV8HVN5_9ACTN
MTATRKLTAALACAVGMAALMGCGGGHGRKVSSPASSARAASPAAVTSSPAAGPALKELTAAQISDRAMAAMKGLSSAVVDTQSVADGQTSRTTLAMTAKGVCTGHLKVSGATLAVVRVGGTTYIKGDNAWWKGQGAPGSPGVAAVVKGRWVKMTAGSMEDKTYTYLCDLSLDLEIYDPGQGGVLTKGAPTVVDGEPVIPISGLVQGSTQTTYVATRGKPYVVKSVESGPDAAGVDFSGFDEPVSAVAPPASQTVDESELTRFGI